ncbi:MAG: hypothetical protein HY709_08420, partial [Candidatus Latescibacteria bacterium]|nr:hypothetical protein [Candidatus Latescibacterota bacterium]
IYDVAGRRIRTLIVAESFSPGRYRVSWDGLNYAGRAVASGVYIATLQVGTVMMNHKMMLVR